MNMKPPVFVCSECGTTLRTERTECEWNGYVEVKVFPCDNCVDTEGQLESENLYLKEELNEANSQLYSVEEDRDALKSKCNDLEHKLKHAKEFMCKL